MDVPPSPKVHCEPVMPGDVFVKVNSPPTHTPTGVVVISEPGRALGPDDVGHSVGAAVVARVSLDPAVARAVDAGFFAARVPRSLARQLQRVTQPPTEFLGRGVA